MRIVPASHDEDDEIFAEINITPLTDVFLVLLIIFMITGSAVIESGGKVNLPKAVTTEPEVRGTTVTLTGREEMFVNQTAVSETTLELVLGEALKVSPTKKVILRGDREVLLGEAVRVLSMIKRAGAAEIAIAAEPEEAGRPGWLKRTSPDGLRRKD